ncbi:hypothetical protein [Gloeomargarita lithophora]|nr:hypothetical protein [Gloeomargarita lithophora]
MRDFRAYLVKRKKDIDKYWKWLNQDQKIKTMFIEGWENPNKSELLEACNHEKLYRFPLETAREIYCGVMFEKLEERRPMLEKFKTINFTRKKLLVLELAQSCLIPAPPPPKITHVRRSPGGGRATPTPRPRWESHPVPWNVDAEPELWTSRQERSTALTQLEKLGLVQCQREGRKTIRVALTQDAIEWIKLLIWPSEPEDSEAIVKIYYSFSQKYRKCAG